MVKAAKAEVIPIGKKSIDERKQELVLVDFLEFDHYRSEVQKVVANFRKRNLYPKGAYDKSNFYIGRKVTRISFYSLYVSQFQMAKLVRHLGIVFHDVNYKYYTEGTDLHVYFRGTRGEERKSRNS